jgi:hypothetical protein
MCTVLGRIVGLKSLVQRSLARALPLALRHRWKDSSAVVRLNNWNETESFLEQFLYVSRTSDRVAEDVWRDVISLRNW